MAEKKKKPYEIGELDQYLFGQGTHYEIYKKMGAHRVKKREKRGRIFCSMGTACAFCVCSGRFQ